MRPMEGFLESGAGFDLESVTEEINGYAKELNPGIKVEVSPHHVEGKGYSTPEGVRFLFTYKGVEHGFTDDEPSGLTIEVARQALNRFFEEVSKSE